MAGALVALVATLSAVAWLESPPPLTAAEAVDVSRDAFRSTGRSDVEVDPHPELGRYVRGDQTLEVWKTSASLDEGTVGLWIERDSGDAVYLDDLDADGTARLLSEAEVGRLASFDGQPSVDRHVRRNLAVTFAALLIAGVVMRLLAAAQAPSTDRLEPPVPVATPRGRDRPLRAARIEA